MMKTLAMKLPKSRRKKRSASVVDPPPDVATFHEERVLHQEINIPELNSVLQDPAGWSTRDVKTIQNLVSAAQHGILSVVYSRNYDGRWYARGSAQLQNCKKEIRAKALKGKGYGLDVCASYPSLMAGLTTEVVKKRGATCSLPSRPAVPPTSSLDPPLGMQIRSKLHLRVECAQRCVQERS